MKRQLINFICKICKLCRQTLCIILTATYQRSLPEQWLFSEITPVEKGRTLLEIQSLV